jgi:predicted DNA-binding transcriptional regulator AlpA
MTDLVPLSRPAARIASTTMPPDQLAQLAEVADILGVSKRTAARAVERPGFPAPVDVLSTGRVWQRSDVEAWGRENPPRGRGRPPKRDR